MTVAYACAKKVAERLPENKKKELSSGWLNQVLLATERL